MAEEKPNPATESSDYQAMSHAWAMIEHIRAGAEAVRTEGTVYLPKYDGESENGYAARLASAPWRPEFTDALRSMVAKPFTSEVKLAGDPPPDIKAVSEDIDGQGNNLHVFAREVFESGVAAGLHGIYVTFPPADGVRTLADEKAAGLRPYWVSLRALDIVACYVRVVGGKTKIEHMRLREDAVVRNGFEEEVIERVRVLELDDNGQPTSCLWEKRHGEKDWTQGPVIKLRGVTELPVVLFFTARREGHYRVRPPLIDLAEMQMEIYRAGARKEEVLTYAGSPMLKGKGMSPPPEPPEPPHGMKRWAKTGASPVVVGPKTVLYAPPGLEGVPTDWDFIQPNAANITEIREDLSDTIDDFRRLALQPTTARSGVLTATGEAIQGAKAHSAIESWANKLKDALEQALVYTCQWLKLQPNVEVFVHTDFGVDIDGGQDMAELLKARQAGEISRETYWDELRRRGKLGPQFDPEEEKQRLEQEVPAGNPDDFNGGEPPGPGDGGSPGDGTVVPIRQPGRPAAA